MDILTAGFQGTVQWILQHGYFFIFVLMFVEGPVVTAAAAFAAALNYLNIWAVFILSVAANLGPDALYYLLGYWGRKKFIDRFGHYFGITPEKVRMTERLLHENAGKSLFIIKTVPLLATPGLIVAGASKMDVRKYSLWCIIIAVPSSALYLVIGYYFGAAYTTIDRYLHLGAYVIAAAVAIIGVVIWLQRRYSERLFKKFKDEK